jgi:hypothetical protein
VAHTVVTSGLLNYLYHAKSNEFLDYSGIAQFGFGQEFWLVVSQKRKQSFLIFGMDAPLQTKKASTRKPRLQRDHWSVTQSI